MLLTKKEYRQEVERVADAVKERKVGFKGAMLVIIDHDFIHEEAYHFLAIKHSETYIGDLNWTVYVDWEGDYSEEDIFRAMALAVFYKDVTDMAFGHRE